MSNKTLMTVHAELAAIQSQQVEINRRLVVIEKSLEESQSRRFQELETAQEKRRNWVEEIVRLVTMAAILTGLSWVASLLGLDLVWS